MDNRLKTKRTEGQFAEKSKRRREWVKNHFVYGYLGKSKGKGPPKALPKRTTPNLNDKEIR